MIRSEHNEIVEVFLCAYRDAGFDAAIEAVANAAVMYATRKSSRSRRPTARALDPIVAQLAEALGTTTELLRSMRKHKFLSDNRHLACWLLRQDEMPWARLSYPIIAVALAMSNHTSALHGARRVESEAGLLARGKRIAARVRVERIAA